MVFKNAHLHFESVNGAQEGRNFPSLSRQGNGRVLRGNKCKAAKVMEITEVQSCELVSG